MSAISLIYDAIDLVGESIRSIRTWMAANPPAAVNSGASFPASGNSFERFWRTDRQDFYYWDPILSMWLSEDIYNVVFVSSGTQGSNPFFVGDVQEPLMMPYFGVRAVGWFIDTVATTGQLSLAIGATTPDDQLNRPSGSRFGLAIAGAFANDIAVFAPSTDPTAAGRQISSVFYRRS